MKNGTRFFIGFVFLVLIIIFAVINTDVVHINFGIMAVAMPLIYVILGSTAVGAIIVSLLWFSSYLNQRKEMKQLKADKAEYVQKLDQMVDHEVRLKEQQFIQEIAEKDRRIAELESEFSALKGEPFVPTSEDY